MLDLSLGNGEILCFVWSWMYSKLITIYSYLRRLLPSLWWDSKGNPLSIPRGVATNRGEPQRGNVDSWKSRKSLKTSSRSELSSFAIYFSATYMSDTLRRFPPRFLSSEYWSWNIDQGKRLNSWLAYWCYTIFVIRCYTHFNMLGYISQVASNILKLESSRGRCHLF